MTLEQLSKFKLGDKVFYEDHLTSGPKSVVILGIVFKNGIFRYTWGSCDSWANENHFTKPEAV